MSFPQLVAVLHRRRWLLFGGVLLGGLFGGAATLAIPPVFTAQTLLLLEPQAPAGAATPQGTLALDSGAIDSQSQILASRSLAREVIAKLALADDPDLQPDPGRWRRLLNRLTGSAETATPEAAHGDRVGRFLDRLTVRREGKSYVITVAYRSGEPGKAARVANTVAELYQAGQLARKQEAVRRAHGLLAAQAELARLQLGQAVSRLKEFRARTEQDRGQGMSVGDGELAEISRQLVLTAAERSEREARLGQLRASVAQGQGGVIDRGSALLQNLSALKAELLRKEAELSGQYGERHPKLLDLRSQKAELDARIAEEQQAQLRGLASEVEAARAKERTLARSLEELKGRALRQDDAARGAEMLEHEVDLDRRLYESLTERANAAAELDGAHEPDARVISEAVPPSGPSFPKPRLLVSLGGTVGLSLGLLLIYLIESRDRGFAHAGEVRAALDLPTLALVPEIAAPRGAAMSPQDYVLEKPRSRYAEALREVLASLLADRSAADPGRVVLVTSALPDEGKSTLVLSLGRLAASEGLRVLAIDVDLRRPSLHTLAGLKPGPGVIELLRGEVGPDEVMHADPRSALGILASSGRLSQPTRLLTADRLGRVLELVRTRFDLILVDAAPLAAVADPRLLAPLADRTLLTVRHACTRREVATRSLENLRGTGATLAGVVLTRVDPRRQHATETGPAFAQLTRYYAD